MKELTEKKLTSRKPLTDARVGNFIITCLYIRRNSEEIIIFLNWSQPMMVPLYCVRVSSNANYLLFLASNLVRSQMACTTLLTDQKKFLAI